MWEEHSSPSCQGKAVGNNLLLGQSGPEAVMTFTSVVFILAWFEDSSAQGTPLLAKASVAHMVNAFLWASPYTFQSNTIP